MLQVKINPAMDRGDVGEIPKTVQFLMIFRRWDL